MSCSELVLIYAWTTVSWHIFALVLLCGSQRGIDENRGHLLEAGYPQTVLSLLEAIADRLPHDINREPLPLTIPELKLVKTAIGVILNISLNYGSPHFPPCGKYISNAM